MAIQLALGALKVFGVVKSAIKAGFGLIAKYPVQSLVVVAASLGGYWIYGFAYDRGSLSRNSEVELLRGQLVALKTTIDERNKKISELEGMSSALSTSIQEIASSLKTQLTDLTNTYEANLAEARKNPKVVTEYVEVKVPGKDRIVEVMVQNGNVVCDRYPEGYTATVNSMVDATVKKMRTDLSKRTAQ